MTKRPLNFAVAIALLPLISPTLLVAAEECSSLPADGGKNCSKDNPDCKADHESSHCPERKLQRITVVGTRFGIDVDKYPGSASVLTADDLDHSTDLIRALDRVPGFDTGLDNGRSVGQQYSIRGFGYSGEDRVIVMQDGVRRSTNLYSNQTSSFRMDSDLLKQVDIVRGSSSVSHGGGAIGGVIDTTTKDAADFILPGRNTGAGVNLRYDSNNQQQGYLALAAAPEDQPFDVLAFFKKSDKGDLTLANQVFATDGRPYKTIDNDEDMQTAFFKASWNFGEDQRISMSHFDYEDQTAVTWQSLYHQEYSTVSGPVLGALAQKDTVLRYTATPSDLVNLSITGYDTEAYYDRGYTYVAANGTEQTLAYKNQDERRGLSAQNLMQFSTGQISHRLLLGADYLLREEDASYVLNGVPTAFGSMPNEYRDLGVFFQHELSMLRDRLIVQLGGRYDSFEREVRGVAEDYDNNRFSPRVGFSFELRPNFNLLANYAETFRAPTPHETSSDGPLNPNYWYLPNPDLGPETSAEYEAGFSWRRNGLFGDNDELRIKAMYFTGTIEDMIAFVADTTGPRPPQSTYYGTYRNIGEVDRDGIELEASYDTRRWSSYLSYEQLDQVNALTGAVTPWAFADAARTGFNLHPFEEDISLDFSIKHWLKPDQNPETLVSGGVTYFYVNKSFTQADLAMRWRPQFTGSHLLDGSTQILLGVNNVFDQKRLHPANVSTSTRIGLGRNIYLSLSKLF